MTITPCPQGCGGYVNTADVVCSSCRRPLNEVSIMEFAWPGACFEWFGPSDHRCRCRRPKGHEGEHDTHNREGCGARGEGSGDIGCDMPRGHDGPHDWELFESTVPPPAPDTALYQGAWRWNEDKTARLMSAEDWLEAEARVDEMLDSGKDRGGVMRAIAKEMRQIRARLTAQAVPPSAPDTLFKFGDHTPEEQSAAAEALHAANIARAVLRRRLDEGWSQGELAALAKTTQARVSEIESLKGDPKLSTLGRVAYALGCMIDLAPIDCEPVPPSAPDTKPDEQAEIAALRAEREAMRHVIAWLLGEEDEFPTAPDELHALLEDARQYNLDRGEPVRRPRIYWWRGELRDRWAAAISVGPDNPANLRASSPPEGEDTQRLDWLERNSAVLSVFDPPSGDSWVWEVSATDDANKPCEPSGQGDTLREAIDSARAAIPPQKTGHE